MSASLESLFERYRARGELAPLGEVFDRTSGGLLALAVHLVRDPVEAEDLVQATYLAAIEGAATFQGGRRLEPWLAGILARQAARVWRRRGRASEARTEAEADPRLDPSFAAERRELAEALELALVQLAPRERELLRRYLAGETPLELARSQGRGAGAVRMQLLRGIEKLRRLLPSGLHALLPLARLPRGLEAVRGEVLSHAGGAAVLTTAAIVSPSLGALVLSTKLVAATLAVSALVFVSLRTLDEDPGRVRKEERVPAREELGAATRPAVPTTNTREPIVVASTDEPAREPGASSAPPPLEGLVIEGRFLPRDLLRENLKLTATRVDGAGVASTEVRSDGSFRFTGLEPEEYVLSLDEYLGGDGGYRLAYPDQSVRAPARGVEFGRELGLVRFKLAGEALARQATLRLCDERGHAAEETCFRCRGLQLTYSHPIELLVDRRREFSVALHAAGGLVPWRTIPPWRPTRFEQTLELSADEHLRYGALELTWTKPEWMEAPPGVEVDFDGGFGNRHGEVLGHGCRIEGLPPARYRIVVVPFYHDDPPPTLAVSRTLEVEIEAGRTTHARVEWCLGGGARFVPEGRTRGGFASLDVELRDGFGVPCVAHFEWREDGPERRVNSSAQLPLLHPSELAPNLAPGAYTLVLYEGGRESGRELVQVPFLLRAGELVDVPVVLPD